MCRTAAVPALILGAVLVSTVVAPDALAEERVAQEQVAKEQVAKEQVAKEQVAEIVAVHVRDQGHPCGKAESAKRDPEASTPEEAVWVLRCDNASYRVRLIPDMRAHVQRLE